MPSFVSAATILASLTFSAIFGSVSAYSFNSAASDKLAVYWGQGNAQKPLSDFCTDDTIDIIPIGFVNSFPDQAGSNGYPGTDFGNACGGFYTTSNNQTTKLLASCPALAADIKTCQANGKKILLSLGGGSATGAYIASDESAVQFADFLWGAFGPQTREWVTSGQPRPFGDAVVDGFDFDIESLAADIPTGIDVDAHYAAMANEFRRLFDLCDSSQRFYLSAAPQCIVPDGHLADAISKAVFDFIFVQFYNTPRCSARAHFDHTYGQAANGGVPTDISYDTWITWMLSNSANKATKVYIGLPAAPGAAASSDYLTPTEAGQLITDFKCKYPANFGGVVLWEATYSDNNQINGQSYAQNIKPLLTGCSCPISTPSSTSATTSSTTSSTSTTLTTSITSTTWATTTSTLASPISSSTTASSTTNSSSTCEWDSTCTTGPSSTPVDGQPTSSSITSTTTSSTSSSSSCAWGSICTTALSSTPVDGQSTLSSTSTTTVSSSSSSSCGWGSACSTSSSSTTIDGQSTSTSTPSTTTISTSISSSCAWGSACSTSSSTTPVDGQSTSSSPTSTSSCAWGSVCNTGSSSTPVNGDLVSSTTTASSSFSTPTAWSTSTSTELHADPTTTAWSSWSADPSSTSSASLTPTWPTTRPTDPATLTTSTSVTSVTSIMTMTIVPVPSSVWYASTFSRPSSIPISSISLASTATAASSPWSSSSSISSAVKSASGTSSSSSRFSSGVSSWQTSASVVNAVTTSSSSSAKASTALPAITMTTVSVAQGATWSSDPSLTLSTSANSVQATNAAPFTTFTGGASRQVMEAKGVWVVMGVMGLVGALLL